MQLEQDLVVKVGSLELVFEEPALNDWATIVGLQEKPLDEQAEFLFPKLKDIRGEAHFADGTPLTLESIRDKRLPARVFVQIVRGWTDGVVAGLKGEAEAKNG